MLRIIIFASGSGTNAENIIEYFKNSTLATVTYVLSNNENAGGNTAGTMVKTFF